MGKGGMGPGTAAPESENLELVPPAKRAKKGRWAKKSEEDETPRVAFASADKAPQLSLSAERLCVTGTTSGGGGYRMARASHGVSSGCWYWECAIAEDRRDDCHYRIGWATKKAPLQAPVGYDRWSFAYRDLQGSLVHASNRVDDYGEAYGPGDVVGCMIVFGDEAVEDLDEKPPEDASARHVPGTDAAGTNYIRFFKNGKDQGVAFLKLPPGTYYPAVSVYKAGQVAANFGPTFATPIADLDLADCARLCVEREARPLSDLIPPPPPEAPASGADDDGESSPPPEAAA